MQETKISLKLKHGEEIRRISLNEKNFISLQKQINQVFGLNDGSFTLKYKDEEGDLVTIASDEELIEAFQYIQNNLLKIEIISNSEGKKEKCGRWRGMRNGECEEKQKNQSPNGQFKHAEHPFYHNRGNVPPHPFHRVPFNFGGFFQPENVPSFNPFQNENSNPFHHQGEGNVPPHPFHCVPFNFGGLFQPENTPSSQENKAEEFPFFNNLKETINMFANPINMFANQFNQQKDEEKGSDEEESFLEDLLNNALFDIEAMQSNPPSDQPKVDIKQKIEENVQQELFENTKQPETEIPSNSNVVDVENKVVYPFENKLQDLSTMGFDDRKKNILALVQNKGDIQLTIEYLLQN